MSRRREDPLGGDANFLQDQRRGVARALAEFVNRSPGGHSTLRSLDDERSDSAMPKARIHGREHDVEAGEAPICDPLLGPVEHPVPTRVCDRSTLNSREVASGRWLARGEPDQQGPTREPTEILALLRIAAREDQGSEPKPVRRQARLDSRAAIGQLLNDEGRVDMA